MIIDLEVNPDNPIYKGRLNSKVIEKGKKKYYELEMTQESVELIRSNFYKYFLGLKKDGRPILIKGAAPTWIQLIVVVAIMQSTLSPDIEYKKGKDKIRLTE